MRDPLTRALLWLLTAVFAVVAGLGLLAPWVLFDTVHLALGEPAAHAEIRAAYFGLFGTAAWAFQQGARHARWRRPALVLGALILGGFTTGRLLSLVLDGAPSWVGWVNLTAESLGLVAALVLLRLGGRQR